MMTFSQLEQNVFSLSLEQQLRLMERLSQNIRRIMTANRDFDAQLASMAADPEIQNELHRIAEEFAVTEADGLEIV